MVQKISLNEREQIFKLLSEKEPIAKIANVLGRNKTSIYRELKRLFQNAYSPSAAHALVSIKAKNSKKKEKLQNKELRDYVTQKLTAYWSPEQISKRLLLDYQNNPLMHISHETIYRFIYKLKDPQEKEKLILCLRQRKKKRHSRKRKKGRRTNIPNPTSIWDRPKEIEDRKELGHWEGDLIVGKGHATAIGTLVERKTRYTLIVPLFKNKFSVTTVTSFAKAFESLPKSLIKSLTYDRGSEMSWHEVLTKHIGIKVYFADPHSPWQRGTNENTNGLIRQFFPKRTDFSKCTLKEIIMVQDLLNNRPRKSLGFMTPQETLTSLM